MNQWAYVCAAYGLTVLAVIILSLLSWRSMRRAEAQADAVRRKPPRRDDAIMADEVKRR